MEINRSYIQELGLSSFLKNNGFLFAEFIMGIGKTKLAIDIIKHLRQDRVSPLECLFVCHTVVSRDTTTPNEFATWKMTSLIDNREVQLVQYEGLDYISGRIFDLVIFDECHLITERRYQFFQRNQCRRVLLLSGTRPDDPDKMKMILELCKGNILKYDLTTATRHGTVNDILFKLVEIDMSESENEEYARIIRKMQEAQRRMPQSEGWLRMIINERMWWVYKNKSKLQAMMYMANGMREKDRRFLMFTTTKEQADLISPYTMYSGKKDTEYHRFCAGTINELCTVKQIESGANIPNLRYAVAQQINSKKHNVRQLAGRLLRGNLEEVATFWIIVLRSTIDEAWVYDAMKGIPKEKIKRIRLARSEFEQIPLYT
jgi:superfamily II DNA or RNA helicase